MKGQSCIDCQTVFDSPNALNRHKPLHRTTQPAATMSGSNTPEYQPHFSIAHWRETDKPGLAFQGQPNHGYQWASPELSPIVHDLLERELLTLRRRGLEGFPTLATIIPSPPRSLEAFAIADNKPLPLPPPDPTGARKAYYSALVIDCEMVELSDRIADLIRVSVVNFMTGAIVLNHLVQPTGIVKDWRSRVSGVDSAILHAAKTDPRTTVLQGWPEARSRIFAVADARTVLIGHALSNDLKILRIAAERVVDSLVLTAHAVFGNVRGSFPRSWGLKSSCKTLLGVEIQKRHAAHDPLEDALATRELVLWCLAHGYALREWGDITRVEYEKAAEARRLKQIAEAEERRRKRREEDAEAEAAEAAAAAAAAAVGTDAAGLVDATSTMAGFAI